MPNGIQLQQNTRYANRFRRNTDNFIVVECDTNVVEAKCMDEIVDDEIVECKETIKNQKRDISNLRRDFNKIERKVFQLERENRELKKKQLKNRVIITEKQTKIDKMMIDNKTGFLVVKNSDSIKVPSAKRTFDKVGIFLAKSSLSV